jgi:hypothetical protein
VKAKKKKEKIHRGILVTIEGTVIQCYRVNKTKPCYSLKFYPTNLFLSPSQPTVHPLSNIAIKSPNISLLFQQKEQL